MARKKTHEEYIRDVGIKSPTVEVIGIYAGDRIQITHKCKICNNEWLASPSSILQGHGCPVCGKLKAAHSRRRTYDEYVKEVEIINPNIEVLGVYTRNDVKISHRCKICQYEWNVVPNSILNGSGCPKCADVQRAKHFRKSHENYIRELSIINPDIEVLGTYVNAHTKIKHKCIKCQYVWEPTPDYLICGGGCPVCAGKAIGLPPEYKNSIFTSQFRELFELYITEEQMKQYMPYSNKKIDMVCPDCGRHKKLAPHVLIRNGLGCTCSDGQTYPNKFVYAILNQLGIEYEHEYSPDWIKPKRYDIYIPSLNCIIENHGSQHYEECTFTQRTLEEEQKNDLYKKEVALRNGVDKYIIIDCKESTMEYIKNSIINSELFRLLHLDNIDWDKCNAFATSNLVKEAAKLWESGLRTTEVSQKMHIAKGTASKYLMRAAELQWCTYTKREAKCRGIGTNSGANNKKSLLTVQLSLDNELIHIWPAESVAKRTLGIHNISPCCQGIRNQAGGYNWKHLYDHTKDDGTIIPGAISLNLITEEQALAQLHTQQDD